VGFEGRSRMRSGRAGRRSPHPADHPNLTSGCRIGPYAHRIEVSPSYLDAFKAGLHCCQPMIFWRLLNYRAAINLFALRMRKNTIAKRPERAAPLTSARVDEDTRVDSLASTMTRLRMKTPTIRPVTMRSKTSSRKTSSLFGPSNVQRYRCDSIYGGS
jgi:hypothetical protein